MLTFKNITLKSATLGEESIIPDIHDIAGEAYFNCDESVPKEQLVNIGKGIPTTKLPYKMQNMYNRAFTDTTYKAAILENEYLVATFLPELGGRLWSLYDKKAKRDIVYANDALIFANLGYSNVWFAGGVEWNVGMRGHCALGCRSLFARKAVGKNGNDILQMYEYEEKRGIVYCINATLDENTLLVHPEIHNISGQDCYMYWWSNIAVEQTPKTRTFVPTDYSYITSYREGGYQISRKEIPYMNGEEMSYCGMAQEAIDYFYDIPKERNKWICSLNEKGQGLLHCSDERLQGRKNFLWGHNAGGRHWNEWLTEGRDYYEIQAGLLKTQFESFVMKKDEVIKWTESYVGVDLGTNEGDFFDVSDRIDAVFSDPSKKNSLFDIEQTCPLSHMGSGKGYLASLYGNRELVCGFEFPKESVGKSLKFYVDLFYGNKTDDDINTDFTANPNIISFLENKSSRSWFEDYILALGVFEKGKNECAYELLKSALQKNRHYLSLASLAMYEDAFNHDRNTAFKLISEAIVQRPDYYPLVSVYGEIAMRAERYAEFAEFFENACEAIKNNGRIIMYASQCYTMLGQLDKASMYLNEDLVVPDVREGEYAVSNVWVMLKKRIMARDEGKNIEEISDFDVLDKYPVPYSMDFRMHPQKRGE